MKKKLAEAPKQVSISALRQELRRGTLVLAVLAVLRDERHGAEVREMLTAGGVAIDDGALYPMLRRLEDQGLLRSDWRFEGSRNKRFYMLAPHGLDTFKQLVEEWREQTEGVERLIRKEQP